MPRNKANVNQCYITTVKYHEILTVQLKIIIRIIINNCQLNIISKHGGGGGVKVSNFTVNSEG
jgi:hypothetical protein